MKKLCRLIHLKKCVGFQHTYTYCTYLRLCQKLDGCNVIAKSSLFPRRSSNQTLPNINEEIRQLSDEYPEPKRIMWRIINEAYEMHRNPDIKPKMIVQQTDGDENNPKMWRVSLTMTWPEKFQVNGIGSKKSEAEHNSYLNACQKMKLLGILDANNNPMLPSTIVTFGDECLKTSKGSLGNIYQRIWARTGKKEYIPKFQTVEVKGIFGNDSHWKSQLSITFPEVEMFEGHSKRLREAEAIASAKALHWLQEKGIINKKRRIVTYSKEEEHRMLHYHLAPYSVCIPMDLQDKMKSVLKRFEDLNICEVIENMKDTSNEEAESYHSECQIHDVMTEKLYCEPTEEDVIKRSREMFEQNVVMFESSDQHLQELKLTRKSLPIAHKKDDILRLLEENQVVVLSGETGCGKTTQVPQYILDHCIDKMRGANCNIVVTQPRRISAISIAERVAYERNEKVGNTIGHQVRLNKILPQNQGGAILYCTTGMLLRKLCSNPNLDGISHVIVDEVHERNIQIDFLLILLKRLLESNKNVKILMMSASFNTFIFSQYFNKCPVIHVPGVIHPVTEFFLEDLQSDIPGLKVLTKKPILDADVVAFVINRIHETQKPGAILCFLPGWHDIMSVHNKLLSICRDPSTITVCCAHSRLPHEEQAKIFAKPQHGVRKVILATNIAETSVTVDDVVYVVNSGLHKGTSFDGERGVASLGTHWITKANVRQRRGRAGRTQPGVCYNLFSRKVLMEMDDYPLPELLRMPLESVILDCKLYCPESKAEDFLSMALEPPNRSSLQTGVNELQISGILDKAENLTDLGEIVVKFATHPRLSVALVYATFLRCLDPVLNVCSITTFGKEPFVASLEEKSLIKNVKRTHDNCFYSDHLALSSIFGEWQKLNHESNASQYIEQNLLDEQNLLFIKDLKSLFAEDLVSAGILGNVGSMSDPGEECNLNMKHVPSIFASLTAAFFPNLIKVIQGEIAHGRLNKDTVIYSLLKGQHGYIQKESVASNEYELPSPWLIYFSALQSEARRLMMTSAVSAIPGICLLLFAGKQLSIIQDNPSDMKDSVLLMIDDYKKLTFSCSTTEAELLMQWRQHLNNVFSIYITNFRAKSEDCDKVLEQFNSEFVPVLKEVLETPQVPFTKGLIYKFVDHNLESEEL